MEIVGLVGGWGRGLAGGEVLPVEGGEEADRVGGSGAVVGGHAGVLEEGVEAGHGGEGFGVGGLGGGEEVLDKLGGEAEAAEEGVDDDAGDGAHFLVEEQCAEALIEAVVAVGEGDAAEGCS